MVAVELTAGVMALACAMVAVIISHLIKLPEIMNPAARLNESEPLQVTAA
jgi:hypothetical protein